MRRLSVTRRTSSGCGPQTPGRRYAVTPRILEDEEMSAYADCLDKVYQVNPRAEQVLDGREFVMQRVASSRTQ